MTSEAAAVLATAALLGVFVLATLVPAQANLADRLTLLVLALGLGVFCWNPRLQRFHHDPDAVSFVLTAVAFVLYGMARAGGPHEGWAPSFGLPDDTFPVSYAARLVVPAALVTLPLWLAGGERRLGWLGAVAAAIAMVCLLALGSFKLVGRFYPVGATEIVDPAPLVFVIMQSVEYGCLTLLCVFAASSRRVRSGILQMLPMLIIGFWAWLHFAAGMPEGPVE